MFILKNSIQLEGTLLQKTAIAVFLSFLFSFSLYSQQLIINEVSQGPNGSKEYVELLVAGTPSCSSIPCMDLRGYYIDDNNGSIASGTGTGIAQGCVRFKNTSFWSCIPIGTLIVIYNDIDQNANIPAQDLTMTDGNCRLVIPANNCTLLETNTDFPSLTSSGFPTAGFTSCGDWNTLAMANSDDSFQTVDDNGNSMFSVSWGNNTNNPTIYFAGTSSATVAYMANAVDNNPANQANWTRNPVAGNETPGVPNNTANAAWIASMNNSCAPLTPITLGTNASNPTCTCDGSITVTVTGGVAPYMYSWSSGDTTATVTGLCAGAYTVTVTGANGCSETTTKTLTGGTGLTIQVNSETICSGVSATLTATGADDYVWSTGETTDGITESPTLTTTYTVVGTSGACADTATGTITVQGALSVTVASITTCAGGTATLTATGADDYVWSNGETTQDITESPTTTTTYTVTGTSNGCVGTATGTITVSSALSVSVASVTTCAGGSATLTATGADSYVWSTGATTDTIIQNPGTTTTYTVTGTSNGCTGTATGTITVGSALSVSVASVTTCAGGSATLTATGANNYVWSTGATTDTITQSPATTTTYTVTGTSNSCTGTATGTITVGSTLSVSVNSVTICTGNSATLTATGADSYVWSVGAETASITESPAATTSYTVTGTSTGCSATATGTITVNPAPVAHFGADKLASCSEFCPNFLDSSSIAGGNIVSWAWDFGDGTSADVATPQHCFSNVGNYDITLTVVSDSGCTTSVTYTDYISIVEPPVADFSYPETPVSTVEPDVTFINTSTNATLWHWDFGDRNDTVSSNGKNPTHIYENHGDYCAVLIASNTLGCADTMEHCFKVEPYYTFYIPNSFTPNNDGKNDEFYGVGDNILECEMSIFDRWGIQVFHTENYDEHWNGRINNVKGKCMQDTYVYIITVKDVNLKMHQYKGSFTLIRE